MTLWIATVLMMCQKTALIKITLESLQLKSVFLHSLLDLREGTWGTP